LLRHAVILPVAFIPPRGSQARRRRIKKMAHHRTAYQLSEKSYSCQFPRTLLSAAQ